MSRRIFGWALVVGFGVLNGKSAAQLSIPEDGLINFPRLCDLSACLRRPRKRKMEARVWEENV